MEVYEAGSINDIYPYIIEDVKKAGERVKIDRPDAVDSFTAELRPVVIHVEDPRQRLLSSRPVNVPFMLAEVLWMLAGRRDVKMLAAYNSRISSFSDDGNFFNAAYGHRLRSAFGHDQLEDVIRTLVDDPSSRQGTLVISNPVDDKGWDRAIKDPDADEVELVYRKKITKDRACNVLSHVLLRDGNLDWLQVVRSNDLVWGLPYNWMQFTHFQEYIAARLSILGVQAFPGTYTHTIHSAHIYSHHFDERTPLFNLYDVLDWAHPTMLATDDALNLVMREEEVGRKSGPGAMHRVDVGEYWDSVLWILRAGLHFKNRADAEARLALLKCSDPVLALTTLRFFFSVRWHKDVHQAADAETYAEEIVSKHIASTSAREDVVEWITKVPRQT